MHPKYPLTGLAAAVCALGLSSLLGLSACGGTPTPTPTPTATPSSSPSPSPTPSPVSYDYDLPLTAIAKPECEGKDQLLYDISASGRMRYYPGDYNPFGDGPTLSLQERQLSGTERQNLDALLEEIDIAKQFEASTPVPDDAPQTAECRTVLEYSLQVNGQTKTYDANGRKFSHTQAYRDALEKLRLRLEALKAAS